MKQSNNILELLFYSENMKHLIHNALIRTLEPGFHFGPHCHQNIELCLMEKGSCDIVINGDPITVHSHEFIVLFPNVIHTFDMPGNENCQFLQLHFSPEDFLNLDSKLYEDQRFLYYIATGSRQYLKSKFTNRLLSCIERITNEMNNSQLNHIALANLYIYELMLLLSREVQHSFQDFLNVRHPIVIRATRYIHENIDQKLSLDSIASDCNVSKRYLTKVFQENMHVTVNDYIHLTKMNHAMEEITKDNCDLSTLAYRLGYSSVQYFTTVFKKFTGVTPKKFCILQSIKH